MRRIIGAGCAVAALVTLPTRAFADETPPEPPASTPQDAAPAAPIAEESATTDAVHLRDGGMVRGRVTEIVPGDHVTIRLLGGEQRRIAWPELDRVVVATPGAPAAPTPSASTSPPAPPPMVGPTVRVHIKSSSTVHLHRRAAGTSDFVHACPSPCDMDLPLGDTYKIGGGGIQTTKEFRLTGSPGQTVEIDVDGPSWLGIIGGGLLTLAGGFTTYVGLILTLAGASSDSSAGDDVRNVGLGALVVGGSLIAVGLLIVFPSMKTDVTQETVTPGKDAFVRTPTWRAASSGVSLPRATFPVLFEQRF